jgi:hypothetical protein
MKCHFKKMLLESCWVLKWLFCVTDAMEFFKKNLQHQVVARPMVLPVIENAATDLTSLL